MEQTPWYVSLIVAWLPFLILVALGIWIARRVGGSLRAPDGRPVGQVVDEVGRELKRSNDMLEQALNDCRKWLDALEQRR